MSTGQPDQALVRFPEVTVNLIGEDGNAFSVLGRVSRALREAGAKPEEIREFTAEAAAGDYDALLRTVVRWVNVAEAED